MGGGESLALAALSDFCSGSAESERAGLLIVRALVLSGVFFFNAPGNFSTISSRL